MYVSGGSAQLSARVRVRRQIFALATYVVISAARWFADSGGFLGLLCALAAAALLGVDLLWKTHQICQFGGTVQRPPATLVPRKFTLC